MNLKSLFKRKVNLPIEPKKMILGKNVRSFDAAGTGRLLSTWTKASTSYDYDILNSLDILRSRSRNLHQNNDYARRYINLCVANIIGSQGMKLQNKAATVSGKPWQNANDQIEYYFGEWGRIENCTIDRSLTWLDVQRICITSCAIDGEIFIRFYDDLENKYRLSIQLLESDYCDINFNDEERRIRMGIEYNEYQRPVAYWLYKKHPGDNTKYTRSYGEKVRVPARDIIHIFYKERPSQSRGVPWMHSAMTRLNHLGAYEEAELVASRVASAKMGFITSPSGDGYGGEKDAEGNIQIEAEPGTFEQLPIGWDIKEWSPTHPGDSFGPFMKTTLRGIASGLNVSYHSLASDLESVNYSSARVGSLDERDHWRVKQRWFVSVCCDKIFYRFLVNLISLQITNLSMLRFDAYNRPEWYARSWEWVDPQKDAAAAILEIDNGLRTKTDILAEQGKDFYDLLATSKQEKEMMKEFDIDFKKENQPQKQNNQENQKMNNQGGQQNVSVESNTK